MTEDERPTRVDSFCGRICCKANTPGGVLTLIFPIVVVPASEI